MARWCHAQVSQGELHGAGRQEAKRHDRVCGAGEEPSLYFTLVQLVHYFDEELIFLRYILVFYQSCQLCAFANVKMAGEYLHPSWCYLLPTNLQ